MQSDIDVISVSDRKVVIGFTDQEENDKAHGHVNGANYLPVRDFWGISERDQISILKDTIRDFGGVEEIQIVQEIPLDVTVGDQQVALDTFSLGDFNDF
jgi:hypothetical protein